MSLNQQESGHTRETVYMGSIMRASRHQQKKENVRSYPEHLPPSHH